MKEIDYTSKDLITFPTEIFGQTDVVKLDLSTNTGSWDIWLNPNVFETIPDNISTLKNLEYLDLSRTALRSLPSTFGQLVSLKYLDISSTKLTELPDCIFQLDNLETLKLDNCKIQQLPSDISKLKNLKFLSADNCIIKIIPYQIGELRDLEELHLYNNFITELPAVIGQLNNLRVLKMGNYENGRNQIKELPKEIGQLKKLQYIHLGNNKLKILPYELTGCCNLAELALWSNEFEAIPEWLAEMNLKDLNFYSNPIKHLPDNYKFLTNIKKLTLDKHLDKELEDKKWWKIF